MTELYPESYIIVMTETEIGSPKPLKELAKDAFKPVIVQVHFQMF